jgi:hypothetical protein
VTTCEELRRKGIDMPAQVEFEDTSKQKVNLDKEKNLARNNYSYEKRQKELAKKKKKEDKKQRKLEDKALASEQKATLLPEEDHNQ